MPDNLVLYPNPILRQKSILVDNLTNQDLDLIKTMRMIILSPPTEKGIEAAGISAPQLGVNRRTIVINYNQSPLVMINPFITNHSKKKTVDIEGCLSLPNKFGFVERFQKIKVNFQDEDLKQRRLSCADFLARVIQHEVDHLNGILFIDKIIGEVEGVETLKQ